MKPYYEADGITIYHGDCREILPLDADVVLTDPPYGVDKNGEMIGFIAPNYSEKGTHTRGYHDHDRMQFDKLMMGAWQGCAGIDLAVAFCGNRTMHQMADSAEAAGWQVLDYLAFVTRAGMAKSTTTLRPGFELAAVMRYGKAKPKINPDWKRSNTYTIDKPSKQESAHLTTKPLAWMAALVNDFTEPGQTIVDPFMGGGTTLIAARDLGRKAIGIEIEERYCEIAVKRLAQGVLL